MAYTGSVTGSNQVVVVMDSGLSELDMDRYGTVIKNVNFTSGNLPVPTYGRSHGRDVQAVIHNNAEGVEFIVLRAVGPGADDTSAERAFQWVLDNYEELGITAVNLSFGMETRNSEIERIAASLLEAGVVMIGATGNAGGYETAYPAAFENVISVGATTGSSTGDDISTTVADYSSYNENTELFAGGSLMLPGISTQGTSLAAPAVTAAYSLANDAYTQINGKALTREKFVDIARETGTILQLDGQDVSLLLEYSNFLGGYLPQSEAFSHAKFFNPFGSLKLEDTLGNTREDAYEINFRSVEAEGASNDYFYGRGEEIDSLDDVDVLKFTVDKEFTEIAFAATAEALNNYHVEILDANGDLFYTLDTQTSKNPGTFFPITTSNIREWDSGDYYMRISASSSYTTIDSVIGYRVFLFSGDLKGFVAIDSDAIVNDVANTDTSDLDFSLADDTIYGNGGNNTIILTGINQKAYGNDGDDIIHGGVGVDVLFGGDGDDVLSGGWNLDTLNGGNGSDTVNYSLISGDNAGHGGNGFAINLTAGMTTTRVESLVADTLSNIENVVGSSKGDIITGDDGNNILQGNNGRDIIHGGDGNDILSGGLELDTLHGGDGIDRVDYSIDSNDNAGHRGSGFAINLATGMTTTLVENILADTLSSIENVVGSFEGDIITGNNQDNILRGNRGNDTIYGGDGDDSLFGARHSDTLHGGDGDDSLFGGRHSDTLNGGDGDDVLSGGRHSDALHGGDGDDVLSGGWHLDTLNGGNGIDTVNYSLDSGDNAGHRGAGFVINLVAGTTHTLSGHILADTLSNIENVVGSSKSDEITGDRGDNILHGNDGLDIIHGGNGRDTIHGGNAFDTLHGEDGNDTIYGDGGGDIIHGGSGSDTIYGGDGNDVLSGGWYLDTIDGGSGRDTVNYNLDAGDDAGHGGSGFAINLTTGRTTTIVENILADTLVSIENVTGSSKNDIITGNDENNQIYGGAGDDTVYASAGDDTLNGGDGDDVLSGNDGNDAIYGGRGNDILNGDAGNDTLVANYGDDTLNGGDGDDVFWSLYGNITLNGGSGADRFVFNYNGSYHHTILDFDRVENDKIDFSYRQNITFSDLAIEQNDADTIITGVLDLEITLQNIVSSTITADDFLF